MILSWLDDDVAISRYHSKQLQIQEDTRAMKILISFGFKL